MKIPIMYNLRNLVARKVTTLLTVLGIGLVVFVFAAVLMLARGFRETLMSSGDPSNVIVLRKAATSEMSSSISRNQANILKTQPEVVVLDNGKPLVSGEVVVVNNLAKRSDGQTTNITVRGVSQESLTLRPKVKIVEGRMLRAGTSEIITGKGAAEKFEGCGLGESVEMGNREWTVVGVFDAGGSSFESEIWGDVEQLMQAFRRPVFSTMTMKMKDPSRFASMKERIESDPQLTVDVKREIDFYEEQSRNLGLFIQILGIFVTVVFSFGAMAGAVITMYATVASRASEIGTLRALGFKRRNILASFLIECIFISLVGGALGILFASFLQFIDISTTNWQSFSEVVFGFNLSAGIIIGSMLFSIIMGIIGGFAPAWRAARMQVVDALRAA